MKQSPQMLKIEETMKPGVITLHGFLGNDTRNLTEILVADEAEVRRLKTSHTAIAQRMKEFRKAGEAGLGEYITLPPHFEVRVDDVRGKIPSPFGGPGLYAKTNTTVVNKKSGKEITFTDVHIHLVGDHGFYEGKGSPFRLEPKELVEILEMETEEQQLSP